MPCPRGAKDNYCRRCSMRPRYIYTSASAGATWSLRAPNPKPPQSLPPAPILPIMVAHGDPSGSNGFCQTQYCESIWLHMRPHMNISRRSKGVTGLENDDPLGANLHLSPGHHLCRLAGQPAAHTSSTAAPIYGRRHIMLVAPTSGFCISRW